MKLVAIITVLVCSVYPCFSQTEELTPGKTIQKKLSKDENHQYAVTLKTGYYVSFTVMQKGVDLAIDVYTPSGKKLNTFDSPNGSHGPEQVNFDASQIGNYKITIHPLIDPSIPDSMLTKYKEENQGDYSIETVSILSQAQRQKMLANEKRKQQQFIEWLSANAHPLKAVTAGSGFEDLQWLKPVLQNVKYVGLGEATHGTREFFQMKHRMLEFLVKEMGFSCFAIEASYAGCQNINDYVLYGKGNVHKALASQGFWTWDTEEVIDMIEWMRSYNATVVQDKKLKFYGFDIQVNSLGGGLDKFRQYLQKVDKVAVDSILFKQLARVDMNPRGDTAVIAKQKFNDILVTMMLRKPHYILASSEKEYEEALHYGTVIAQLLDAYTMADNDKRRTEREWRDYYMAANFYDLIQKYPEEKVVIWAHNGHINKDGSGFVNGGGKPFGSYLKDAFGDQYFAMEFAFSKGSFQAIEMGKGLQEFTLTPAKKLSFDWYLASVKSDKYIIDFSQKDLPGYVQNMMNTGLQSRGYGAVANRSSFEQSYGPTYLPKEYDAVIFIDNTTRARPTASGKR